MTHLFWAAFWIGVLLVEAVPGTGMFLWDLSIALGFAGLAMMGLQRGSSGPLRPAGSTSSITMNTIRLTRWTLALPLLLVIAGNPATVTAQEAGASSARKVPIDPKQIERGTDVYRKQRCQTCHAIDGVGNRRNPLDGVGDRLTEEQIRKWIVAPQEMDPKVRKRAYKLPAADLDALVAYMQPLEKPSNPR